MKRARLFSPLALAGVSMIFACTGCAAGHHATKTSPPSPPPGPPKTTPPPPPPRPTKLIDLAPGRHILPPGGVAGQLNWVVGGGGSFAPDCFGRSSAAPAVGFSRVPFNGSTDLRSVSPRLGEGFAACITGYPPRSTIALSLVRP